MEVATTDRIQRMIDEEAAERFPQGAVPRLVLLRYGDHPVIEPGELFLRVILGPAGATRDAWLQEHGDRLDDLRVHRLPEVKGLVVTTDAPDTAGRNPAVVIKMVGISLLDPEEDELARGLTPVQAGLGPVDLATLDALVNAGIAARRSEAVRWALARVREQPAYAELSERPREPGEFQVRARLEFAVRDRLQSRLDAQVKEDFPDAGVQRVALLQYGDDPWVEPGGLLVRVCLEEAEEEPHLPAWEQDQEAMVSELRREVAENLPWATFLEFCFGEDGHQGRMIQRLGDAPDDPAARQHDLTPVGVRLGPVDLEMLDTLIIGGTAASRAEAIGWALARLRERPAYAKLSERARELDDLKARF